MLNLANWGETFGMGHKNYLQEAKKRHIKKSQTDLPYSRTGGRTSPLQAA